MLRAVTGSFNRLLTSLGLVLMGVALILPYFYFRGNDTLLIDEAELERLTPVARDAIGGANAIAALEPYVLGLAVVLFLLGVALLIWGALRLHGVQAWEDREAEARAQKAVADVRDLTPQSAKIGLLRRRPRTRRRWQWAKRRLRQAARASRVVSPSPSVGVRNQSVKTQSEPST